MTVGSVVFRMDELNPKDIYGGVDNATINVSGARIAINLWKRTL